MAKIDPEKIENVKRPLGRGKKTDYRELVARLAKFGEDEVPEEDIQLLDPEYRQLFRQVLRNRRKAIEDADLPREEKDARIKLGYGARDPHESRRRQERRLLDRGVDVTQKPLPQHEIVHRKAISFHQDKTERPARPVPKVDPPGPLKEP